MKSAHTFVYLSFPSPFMLCLWFLGLGWTPFQCLQQHDRLGINGQRVLVFLLWTTHLIEGSALSFIAAAHWRGTPWCFSRLPIKAINRESKIEAATVQLMFTHTYKCMLITIFTNILPLDQHAYQENDTPRWKRYNGESNIPLNLVTIVHHLISKQALQH